MRRNEQLATENLTFGILGLAFSWFPVLGIIFSVIGLNKNKQYESGGYDRSGKQITGKALSIAGLAQSLVMLVSAIFIIFCIIIVVIILANTIPLDYDSIVNFYNSIS